MNSSPIEFHSKSLLLKALIIIATVLVYVAWRTQASFMDFAAFSCGGAAIHSHLDPYLASSIDTCERKVMADVGQRLFHGEVIPVPFPPYTLAFFSLLSYFPDKEGFLAWLALSLIAFATICKIMKSLTELPMQFIIASSCIPLLYIPLEAGQLTPIIFCAYLLMLWWMQRPKHYLASLAALVTMIEPHIGLPTCLGLFVTSRAARIPLCIGGLILLLLSFLVMPAREFYQYFQFVLPEHALSEVSSDYQYSFTHLLYTLGIPGKTAVTIGALQYIFMVLVGLCICIWAKAKQVSPKYLLTCIPTFAAFGGTFLHITQACLINITALFLYSDYLAISRHNDSSKKPPSYLLPAIIALAIPLQYVDMPSEALLYAFLTMIIIISTDSYGLSRILVTGLSAFLASILAIIYKLNLHMHLPTSNQFESLLLATRYRTEQTEILWKTFVELRLSSQGAGSLLLQAPTWVAMAYILFVLSRSLKEAMAPASRS